MQFSAALLATLAAGALAGPTGHLRHMQMHAARDAAAEAAPEAAPVDYTKVDYSGVDFKDMDWNSILGNKGGSSQPATSAAAAPSAQTVQSSQPQVQTKAQSQAQAKPTSAQASSAHTSSAASPSSSSSSSGGSILGDSGILSKLASNALGLKIGTASGNPGITIGKGTYTINAKNNKQEPMLLVFWNTKTASGGQNYASSFVGKGANPPAYVATFSGGESKSISVPSGMSGVCAPVWATTPATDDGQIKNTWLEYTMDPSGVVDVTREAYMGGDTIDTTVKSTGCKSNMSQCSFQCNGGVESCMTGYELKNCQGPGAVNGGGINGGCGWDNNPGAEIDASFG